MSIKIFDIEANNLLNDQSIDYLSSPYKLKKSFKIHCIVVKDYEGGDVIAFYDGDTYVLDGREYHETVGEHTYSLVDYEPTEYTHKQLDEFPDYIKETDISKIIAHNGINYDLMVCKLYFDMDFEVEPDTWHGKNIEIEDTLVTSKTLNPDRIGGHSLDNLGKKVKVRKINFRPNMKKGKFDDFAADMLYYNIRDVETNMSVYSYLEREKVGWEWSDAIKLEKQVAEIVTRQEHRGFKFDKTLAENSVIELDGLMKERREKVNPLLPKKPATKGVKDKSTPPLNQFLKSGYVNKNIQKFAEKIGGSIDLEKKVMLWEEKEYKLPLPQEPFITEVEADIDDSTHIKDWLVGLGWHPSEYKEKDLTVKQVLGKGKVKRTEEEFEKAVETYITQTLNCNFKDHRLDHLNTTEKKLRSDLLRRGVKRSVKVLTNPSFTVGQDKDICPDLERMKDKFPYIQDVVEYLTYKHRRNSILGGGLEWDEEGDAEKGYLAYYRQDGRIGTPADTCGAATSRFKHKIVANIPRVTSLYGSNMRGMFGVDENHYQIGYDFDSLEARIEAHYCWRWDKDKEYCNSLLQEKPNDVHSKTARSISKTISRDFDRQPAKSVKYACTYGATAPKVAKTIGADLETGEKVFDAFWKSAKPLDTLKKKLKAYWENTGEGSFILGIDGRKVPTRSPHAILNSLFQSAGVICAKRAMVIHDRMLKEEGLSVDFFKEDWKNRVFSQQLIAYHDESQLEEDKSLVSFKGFSSKEDCTEGKKLLESKGKIYSDVFKVKDRYYTAYSKTGELAARAVKLAGEYYKLNIELTAGYMVGKNWKDCH